MASSLLVHWHCHLIAVPLLELVLLMVVLLLLLLLMMMMLALRQSHFWSRDCAVALVIWRCYSCLHSLASSPVVYLVDLQQRQLHPH